MYEVAFSPQLHIFLYDYISLKVEAIEKKLSLAHYLSFLLYSIFYRSFRPNQSVPSVNVFFAFRYAIENLISDQNSYTINFRQLHISFSAFLFEIQTGVKYNIMVCTVMLFIFNLLSKACE